MLTCSDSDAARRFVVFSFGYPVVLYYLIAAEQEQPRSSPRSWIEMTALILVGLVPFARVRS